MSYHVDNERSMKALDVLLDKIKDLKVESVHTDKCLIYNNLSYKYDKHTTDKINTTQVESVNAVLRNNLPFLIRKTKAYAKNIKLIINGLKLFSYFYNNNWYKNLLFSKIYNIFVLSNEKSHYSLKGLYLS